MYVICLEIAHSDCADTIRETALKVDSVKKNPCHNLEPAPWVFSWTFYQLSYSCPNVDAVSGSTTKLLTDLVLLLLHKDPFRYVD